MPERVLPDTADFNTVSAAGLKPPPVAAAPAGPAGEPGPPLQQQDGHVFTVEPASNANTTIDGVHRILNEERDIVISSRPLEATAFPIEGIPMAHASYESGLSINVMYTVDDPKKRAAGFKLSEGMEVPARPEPRRVAYWSGSGHASRFATRTAPGAAAAPDRAARAGWSPGRDRACPAARPVARRGLPR